MTKEEFRSASFHREDFIEWEDHIGNIISVDFEFGYIGHRDNKKGSYYSHHYSELKYIPKNDK